MHDWLGDVNFRRLWCDRLRNIEARSRRLKSEIGILQPAQLLRGPAFRIDAMAVLDCRERDRNRWRACDMPAGGDDLAGLDPFAGVAKEDLLALDLRRGRRWRHRWRLSAD